MDKKNDLTNNNLSTASSIRFIYVLINSEQDYFSGVVDHPSEIPEKEGYSILFVSDPIDKKFDETPFDSKKRFGVWTLDKCLLYASQYVCTSQKMADVLRLPHEVVLHTIRGNIAAMDEWSGFYTDEIDAKDFFVDMDYEKQSNGKYKFVGKGFYLTSNGRTVLRRQLGGFFHCIDREF